MQKIISWIFMFLFVGLTFSFFLYVASIIIPILFFAVFVGFLWLRYKQHKAVRLMFGDRKGGDDRRSQGEIIDVEYEIIDDKKH